MPLKKFRHWNKSRVRGKNGEIIIVIACLHISVLAVEIKCKYFSFQYK